jgi:antitoxin component YwqK of YwqJK toxin-antitoxin module/S1-C subfamily serine protease
MLNNSIRNLLLLLLLLFSVNILFSQVNTAEYQLKNGESIIYFDTDWNVISNKNDAEFYRIYKQGPNNTSLGVVTDYFKSGQIQNTLERATFIDLNDNDNWVFDGESLIYYNTGELEKEYNYINTKIEGLHKTFYKSGKLKVVKNYEKGVEQGEYNSFYESGVNRIKFNYINGNIEGDWVAYHESGSLEQTVEYVNNKKQGFLKDFDKSGKLNFVKKHQNGLLLSDESFYDSGKTEYIWIYKDGKRNGTSKMFYESGEVKKVWNYLNGKLNGKSFTFFRNGNEAEAYDYKNGEIINTHVKDKFGNTIYKSNNVNKTTSIYRAYKGDAVVDELKDADNAGGMFFEGTPFDSPYNFFSVAVEDGISQYLIYKNRQTKNDNGDVINEGMYITYYDNGQVKKEINYSNDEKNGEEIFYDRNGNITNKIVWNNGTRDNWSLDCSTTPCEYSFKSSFTDQATAESEGWIFNDDAEERSFVATTPEEAKGTYYWENKDDSGRLQKIKLPIDNTEDFQISVLVDHWNGVVNSPFGMITGFKDWDNYVGLKITTNGFYKAQVVIKGVDVGMQEFKEVDNIYYGPTKLNIVRVDDKLFFSIDKKLVYTSEYSSLIGDFSGIYNSGVKATTFDNFKVVKTAANTSPSPKNRDYSNDDWNGNGSGVIISNSGLIATNFHVIEDAEAIEVDFLYNGQVKSFRAKVIRTDEVNDLAIIKIDDNSFEGLSGIKYNFKTRSSQVGESVFALGYPKALSSMGKDIKFTDGKISSKTGFQGDVTTYQTTTPIQPGNSGGPLFDYKGNLIGINSSKIVSDDVDNVAYTIKSLYLLTLIDSMNENVNLPSDTSLYSLPLTSKIKQLSKYVTLIKVR